MMSFKTDLTGFRHNFLKAYSAVIIIIITLVSGYIVWEQITYFSQTTRLTEKIKLEEFSFEFSDNLRLAGSRIEIAEELVSMKRWLASPSAENRQSLVRDIQSTILLGRQFDSVLFLDADGRDLFGVYHASGAVRAVSLPPAVMERIHTLAAGQIYVAPAVFERSGEKFIPVFRMIKKVYAGNQLRGFSVWELNSERLFRRLLDRRLSDMLNTVLYISPDGSRYVHAGNGAFEAADGYARVIQNSSPTQFISFVSDGGLIGTQPLFVSPLRTISGNSAILFGMGDERWFLVSGHTDYGRTIIGWLVRMTLTGLLIALIAGVVLWRYMQSIYRGNRMERELVESSRETKAIMDSSQDVIILSTDIGGVIRQFNSGAEKILGYRSNEVVGSKLLTDLLPADELNAFLETFKAQFNECVEGTPLESIMKCPDSHTEISVLRRDGSRLQASIILSHKRNAEGEISGLVLVGQDITQMKAMQSAVINANTELKSILESARNVVIIAADKDCIVREFNTGAERILGYASAEVIGKLRFGEFVSNAHLAEYAKELGYSFRPDNLQDRCRMALAMPDFQKEITARRKDGETVALQMVLSHRYDTHGSVSGFVIVGQDISEMRANEVRRNEAYRELKTVMESTHDVAIFSTDRNGLIMSYNPGAEKIFGFSAGEAVGKRYTGSFVTETGLRNLAVEFGVKVDVENPVSRARVMLSIPDMQREMQVKCKDGTIKDLQIVVTHKYNDMSEPDGVVIVSQDISPLKKAQAEMAASKESAEAASRAKSEFLANMSHEIRTPLNSIIGVSDIMYMSETDPEKRTLFQTIQSSSESLLHLINDILDFSKIEAGKIEMEYIEFDFRETLESSISFFASKVGRKQLELICDIAPDVPTHCMGDSARLKQVLINLLSNAVKFTEKGEIVLRAGLKHRDAADWAHIEVIDTGIGISKKDQERIFSKFTQADSSVTRRFGGSGLGLSISRSLVELMGGTMSLESEPGKGSVFSFEIPLEYPMTRTERLALPDVRNISVLIVDDNSNNRMVLERIFAMHNISCISVPGAKEALALLNANPAKFNLIVTDFQMPEMSGLDFVGRMRENNRLRDMKVLVLTSGGSLSEEDKKRYNIAGVLTKPVRQMALLNIIVSLFGSEGGVSGIKPEEKKSASPEFGFGISVLIAEDNEENANLMRLLLNKLKCSYRIVENGQQAVDAVREYRYDAVLMDINMPVMDGITAARLIREYEISAGVPHIPMIALTAQALKGSKEKLIAEGFDDYLAKPITLIDVRSKLAAWVKPGIIIADDSRDNTLLYRMFLKKLNLTPLFASNGQDAVDLFVKNSVSVVITDQEMPIMNGIECMKKIRAIEAERKPAQPTLLVALSGHAVSAQEELWRGCGIAPDAMLVKPVTKHQFIDTLRRLLSGVSL